MLVVCQGVNLCLVIITSGMEFVIICSIFSLLNSVFSEIDQTDVAPHSQFVVSFPVLRVYFGVICWFVHFTVSN